MIHNHRKTSTKKEIRGPNRNHGGFTRGAISYHVGSYWGIYIELKMT